MHGSVCQTWILFSVAESDGRHVVLIDGLEEDLNISLIKALELHCMAFKELDKLEGNNE